MSDEPHALIVRRRDMVEGAIKLRDGFLVRYKPEFKGQNRTFTLTVVETPERLVAVDATTAGVVV